MPAPLRVCLAVLFVAITGALSTQPLVAEITDIEEMGLGGDEPAIIESDFGEDSLTFSDRTHEHNGAAFDENSNRLSTGGSLVVDLPEYLIGNEFIRFANNARDQDDYEVTITTDEPAVFYLLIDNRVNGPGGNTSSSNSTDPELGGTLQWVIDGGWLRVNTGISPDGQPDYTGVDEGGDGSGPGEGLNQFYSVWSLPDERTSVTVSNNGVGGSNMISLVVAPGTGMARPPISSFSASPRSIFVGESVALNWVIDPAATSASIAPGIGDLLNGETDEQGRGSVAVTLTETTEFTLTVGTEDGEETATVTVTVEEPPPVRDFRIESVEESGLGGDTAAIIEPDGKGAEGTLFGEDALTFSDRTHQHNGAAFDGELATGGADIIDLPAYLVGNPYVRFANNARDQDDYEAVITTSKLATFYLLIDNRLDGENGNTSSPNSTDPELGGTLQWVIDGGWERVNTGISPDDLPDYTGVDEGGDGTGPGEGLNQFYSIWSLAEPATSVTVRNNSIGGSNMISLVAAPAGPAVPLEITSIEYDADSRITNVTWRSEVGAFYRFEVSSNLVDWLELDDTIESEGEMTSASEDPVPDDSSERYYRVIESE